MKRQGRFEVHEGRAVLSRHDAFADAEDDASRDEDEERDAASPAIL